MDLKIVWFILIAVLWVGYFVLDGFDLGVGIMLPFLGKDETRRRMIINTVGPHWDGNEVWLLTAGGATFAAFPMWYATLFSGFYLAFFLLLVALIVRGIAFEFRSKDKSPKWRAFWDWAIFGGSAVPALLFGVAFANFVRGVPIDAHQNFTGTLLDLLNPYGILGGLITLVGFALYGAIFLALKTTGELEEQSRQMAYRLWIPMLVVLALFTGATYFFTDIVKQLGINPGPVPIGGALTMVVVGFMLRNKNTGWAFIMTLLTIVLAVSTLFLIMFPRVLVSLTSNDLSLTIYNTSSSPYTLQVMTIVALIFVPVVLVYQGWTYWIFRKRITDNPKDLHY